MFLVMKTPPAELPFLKTGREQLISMQRSDPTLKHCIEAANANIKGVVKHDFTFLTLASV